MSDQGLTQKHQRDSCSNYCFLRLCNDTLERLDVELVIFIFIDDIHEVNNCKDIHVNNDSKIDKIKSTFGPRAIWLIDDKHPLNH